MCDSKTVVLIDDEHLILQAAELVFMNSKYSVIKFSNPKEGLKYILRNPGTIDIILLDIMMPEMSGVELLSRLKSDPNLKNIPVLFQSGADKGSISQNTFSNADGYIAKPYTKTTLFKEIDRVLSLKTNKQFSKSA